MKNTRIFGPRASVNSQAAGVLAVVFRAFLPGRAAESDRPEREAEHLRELDVYLLARFEVALVESEDRVKSWHVRRYCQVGQDQQKHGRGHFEVGVSANLA